MVYYQFFTSKDLIDWDKRQESIRVWGKSTYIDGDEVDLGVAVFSSLGRRHLNDFARTAYLL